MNERQAIEFIMNEIKEQRRADFEFYLKMRNQSTETYERFLDRLRELDERETKVKMEEPVKPAGFFNPNFEQIKETLKDIPIPRSAHMTQSEMRVDRIKVEKKTTTSYEEATEEIERYLKEIKHPTTLKDIQKNVETRLNKHWSNFHDVMKKALELSPFIHVERINARKFFYSYRGQS